MTEILFAVEIDDESIEVTVDAPSIDIGVVESAAAIVTVQGPPGAPGAPGEPGAGGSSLPDIPATGEYWGLPGVLLTGIGALSVTPGGIFYCPFSVSAPVVVTGARFNVNDAPGSTSHARIGIYGADGVGPNAQAPLWDSGPIAIASDFTGHKDSTGLSVALASGRYLATITADNYLGLIGAKRSGANFLGDDGQLKSLFFNIFTFGAFPTPGPAALAATVDDILPFLLQWTNT